MSLTHYGTAFKQEAVRKTLSRGARTVADVARELNVPLYTLKNWLRNPKMAHLHALPSDEKRSQEWSAAERLQALLETGDLNDEQLNAWCRERGLFAHQLVEWRKALETPAKPSVDAGTLRKLREENAMLRRDLNRKDKALAETTALLVLQKKYQALWEDEDE